VDAGYGLEQRTINLVSDGVSAGDEQTLFDPAAPNLQRHLALLVFASPDRKAGEIAINIPTRVGCFCNIKKTMDALVLVTPYR
jgi:hypothetical protein